MRKIVDGRIDPGQLDVLLQQARFVGVTATAANVTFPRRYANTPVVIATPGPSHTYVRVLGITPDSFRWQADASGSAHWMSYGPR